MSTLADALAALDAANIECQTTVRSVKSLPEHVQQGAAGSLEQLAADTYALEAALAQVAAKVAGAPIPMPSPGQAGMWLASATRIAPGLRTARHIPVPPAAIEAAADIRRRAQEIVRGLTGRGATGGQSVPMVRPPVPQARPQVQQPVPPVSFHGAGMPPIEAGLMLPAAVGAAQATVQGAGTGRRVGGFFLSLASLGATLAAAFYAHRHESGHVAPETSETERLRAQGVLDNEAPGHVLQVLPTPGGGWIASVKNGKASVARATDGDPVSAMRQVVADTLRRETLRGELGGAGIEVLSGASAPEVVEKRAPKRRKAAGDNEATPAPAAPEPPVA